MLRFLRVHSYFCFVLLAYTLLTSWLIFRLPAFTGPNEHLHFEYVSWLQRYHEMPNPALSQRMDERDQPPLYYLPAALAGSFFPRPPLDSELPTNPYLTATHQGNLNVLVHANPSTVPTLYAGRFVSMLFGIVALLAIYVAARMTLPVDASALVAALMAFQPYHLYLSAVVGNDSALVATSALILACATPLLLGPVSPKRFVGLGICLGLGLLAKATTVFLLLLLPITCLAQLYKVRRYRHAFLCAGAALAGLVPVWGSLQLYNLYHGVDALGLNRSAPPLSLFKLSLSDYQKFFPSLANVWRSFWLDWSAEGFGYAQDWVYWLLAGLVLLAIVGWLRPSKKFHQSKLLLFMHSFWIVPVILIFLAAKTAMLFEHGFIVTEARWLQPIVPSVAWLLAIGLLRLSADQQKVYKSVLYGLGGFAIVGNLALALWQVPVTFPQAERLADVTQIEPAARPFTLRYGDQLALIAASVPTMTIGERSEVVLYWQALNDIEQDYTISTQLLLPTSEIWRKLDWQNSYPGSGLNPTAGWQKADIYRDRIMLEPLGELNGPTLARLGVWVLEDTIPQHVLPTRNGTELIDPPILQDVAVYPPSIDIPPQAELINPPVRFGTFFDLIAVEQAPGDAQQSITFYWRSQAPSPASYTIFIHLVDANGQVVAQSDSLPNHGFSPTTIWRPGDVIRDPHQIETPFCTSCTYHIGFYDASTGVRLPTQQNGKDLPDQMFLLPIK